MWQLRGRLRHPSTPLLHLRHWLTLFTFTLDIIEGAITMFVGVIILFVLPDFPHTWKLLSPEMKHVANRRMAIDAAEADMDEPGGMSQIRGLKLAMLDPKVSRLAETLFLDQQR